MATVKWTTRALTQLLLLYKNGVKEFGISVARKTVNKTYSISDDLEKWPTSGFPEPLLKKASKIYRARHINKRFKLIYRFEEDNDIVYIEDVWDTRRAPCSLIKRIKE